MSIWSGSLMADPVYSEVAPKILSQVNPCYGVTNNKPLDPATSPSNFEAKNPSCDWFCWCVVIGLVLVGIVACVSMAVAVWTLAKVNGVSSSSAQQAQMQILLSELYNNVSAAVDTLREDAVEDKVDTLTDRIDTGVSNAVDLFHSELNEVLDALSGQLPSTPANSCLSLSSSSPSGHYWANGSAMLVYCDVLMIRPCGEVAGGWRRVASLDFSNSTTLCPSGLLERVNSGIRTCGIQFSQTCVSVLFSAGGLAYSEICGKIIAYQEGTPDAFTNHTIDSYYVDGVSLTHGRNPRHHIWTFAAALDEYGGYSNGTEVCECSHSGRSGGRPPAFRTTSVTLVF